MSESDGEQVARSVALEQAYVHEVYEQCAEKTVQSRHWPRIYQFLEELEPGALVCDIGNFTCEISIVQSYAFSLYLKSTLLYSYIFLI